MIRRDRAGASHRGVTTFAFAALLLVSPLQDVGQHPLAGEWVGGYQRGRNHVYVRLGFTPRGGSIAGTAHVPFQLRRREPIGDLTWANSEATFLLEEREGRHRVSLRRLGDELSGSVTVGTEQIPFRLVRARVIPETVRRTQTGLYRLTDGSYVGITRESELGFSAIQNFRTGMLRSLFPLNDSTFAIGAGWYAPTPRVGTLRFDKARRALTLRDSVGERRGERVSLRKEDVRFRNGNVTLAGTLTLPPGSGPFPAIVFLHGSGPVTRDVILAEYFATQGIATLAYDKRGTGESGGTYTHNVDAQELERLAGDALAAVAFARARADIDARRVGLWGISQAGWIAAIVARSPDVAFSVLVSGPAVSLGEENYYSSLTGDDGDGTRLPEPVVMERMRRYGARGFDPRPFLRQIAGPSLWIFGDRDPSIPVEMSVAVLDSMRRHHQRPITIHRFPNGNHLLLESEVGNRDEYPMLERSVPGYFELIMTWLRQQILIRHVPDLPLR